MDRVISHSAGRMKEKKSGVLADMMNSRIVTASLSLATTVQLWAGFNAQPLAKNFSIPLSDVSNILICYLQSKVGLP